MSGADINGSDVPSLRSLLVVEERMRFSGCLKYLLVTGMVSSHKNSAPITLHGMYFPYTLSFTTIPCIVRVGHGGIMLKKMYGERVT